MYYRQGSAKEQVAQVSPPLIALRCIYPGTLNLQLLCRLVLDCACLVCL